MAMDLVKALEDRKAKGLYRKRQVIESAQGAVVRIHGEDYLNFSNNDYLGLANNPQLKSCMIEAIKKYGVGAASSQLLAGYLKPHRCLEIKLSRFLGREASLVFPSGYQANLAMASVLIDSGTVVLQDKLNHASLIDSALLSKGRLFRYRHKDLENLLSLLEKYKQHRLVVMTDGVFSMDGDEAPLIELAELCKVYQAQLIVDDAHGLGVLGENGAGLLEKLQLKQEQVPVLSGTFGKAFGASGAFISGSSLLIENIIQKARTYIYTTALLPSVALTIGVAIDLISDGNNLRKKLDGLIVYYKKEIQAIGLEPSGSKTPIQPIIIGDTDKTNAISHFLFEKKILAVAIRPPTVAPKTSRLRISINATHSKDQIDTLVDSLKEIVSSY